MAKEVSKKTYKSAKGARNVSISQTQWKTNVAGAKGKAGRLYGPKGQRFTGTVGLGGGKTAVYKQGKRVTPAKTKGGGFTGYKAPRTSNGSSRTSTGGKIKEVTSLPKQSAGPKFGGGTGPATYKPPASLTKTGGVSMGAEGPRQSKPVPTALSQAARAKQRQTTVKNTARDVVLLAHPGFRPFVIGAKILTSSTGKQAQKAPGIVAKKALDWWSGK